MSEHRAMVVTDLDGTLFQRHHRVSEENLQTLHRLRDHGVLCVIATGRNLFSVRKVLPPGFPIDLVVFSSGAGVMHWGTQRLIRATDMSFRDLRRAFRLLREYRLDFMVHRPVPDNHRFVYFASGRDNPDFQARIELYREFATAGADGVLPMRSASQLLAIEPADGGAPPGVGEPPGFGGPVGAGGAGAGPVGAGGPGPGAARARGPGGEAPGLFPLVCRSLPRLNVVRTTSPLDGRSRWIEIFSRSVSKARASRWLARRYRVPESRILALGNDFNDLDLLEWAPRRYLVGDAPAELAERFSQVCAGGEADFSLAVTRWEESLPGD